MSDGNVSATEKLSGNHNHVETYPLPAGIVLDRDVMVAMRDGVELAANVYRPAGDGRYPVLMAISPYGKDDFDGYRIFASYDGSVTGSIRVSDHTAFEASDPGHWVPLGYVVIQVDVRGQGRSGGDTNTLSVQEEEDYCELIAWAAAQSWSDGAVALHGVSYLAITQWFVAQHRPPALRAIVPWEGWTEPYGRAFFEGIPEAGFRPFVFQGQILPAHSPTAGFCQMTPEEQPSAHPLRDAFWQAKSPDLERINVPALVCASFSDQGLHSRDSFVAYERIGSPDKWLYSHRVPKWHAYYSAEALAIQQAFLDHYLKGASTDILRTPRVRYQINEGRDVYTVHHADQWPLPDVVRRTFSLNAADGRLKEEPVSHDASATYDAVDGLATFRHRFERDTAIVGNMAVKLWLEAIGSDDVDLFVGVRKYDGEGRQVYFHGFSGQNANDCVSRGWLRASHRFLDVLRTSEIRPWHTHDVEELLTAGEIVAVEIELLPSGTLFRAGDELELVVQGRPLEPDAPMLSFEGLRNRGQHRIHAGGAYDSRLIFDETAHLA